MSTSPSALLSVHVPMIVALVPWHRFSLVSQTMKNKRSVWCRTYHLSVTVVGLGLGCVQLQSDWLAIT